MPDQEEDAGYDHLAMARQRVAKAEQRTARLEQVIRELRAKGLSTSTAETQLQIFDDILRTMRMRLWRLEERIATGSIFTRSSRELSSSEKVRRSA